MQDYKLVIHVVLHVQSFVLHVRYAWFEGTRFQKSNNPLSRRNPCCLPDLRTPRSRRLSLADLVLRNPKYKIERPFRNRARVSPPRPVTRPLPPPSRQRATAGLSFSPPPSPSPPRHGDGTEAKGEPLRCGRRDLRLRQAPRRHQRRRGGGGHTGHQPMERAALFGAVPRDP
jgi:hypothetical protein